MLKILFMAFLMIDDESYDSRYGLIHGLESRPSNWGDDYHNF